MFAEERHCQKLQSLLPPHVVSLAALRRYDVTMETVRRDLAALEGRG